MRFIARFKLLASILTAVLATGCDLRGNGAVNQADLSVVAGQRVQSNEIGLTSALRISVRGEEGEEQCSGVLIANDLVLTAAHCLRVTDQTETLQTVIRNGAKKKVKRVVHRFRGWASHRNVRVHLSVPGGKSQSLGIKAYRVPPHYDPYAVSSAMDLAVLSLSKIPKPNFTRATLRNSAQRLNPGTAFITLGFGSTNGEPDQGNQKLHKATLVVNQKLTYEVKASGLGSSASVCHGDSGGPAFVQENGQLLLWGITKGVLEPDCTGGSYITDIQTMKDWVNTAAATLRALK